MAVHFLTILVQTQEFVRIQNEAQQQETPNSSFYSLSARSSLKANRPVESSTHGLLVSTDAYKIQHITNQIVHDDSDQNMNPDDPNYSNLTDPSDMDTADLADWLVFLTLETLGISGWIGNLTLLIVIVKSGLLERPSFIFIASLAVADVFHATVTSCYFYPPIVLRRNIFDRLGVQFMNALDWTAWGVTLTHMIAICVDRLLAIVLFQEYSRLVTVRRTLFISLVCWFSFAGVNVIFSSMQLCCIVVPQPDYYTFGFEDVQSSLGAEMSANQTTSATNVYKPLYVPLECLAMLVLAIGNPVILLNLYEKYRRKRTLKAASMVLMEVGQSLCRQSMNMDASLARDVKIFLQIIVVTVIFFIYMFIYYLFFYITEFSDKWSTMLNSICYSITHMINPIVYFSLNEQMQKQVLTIFSCLATVKRRKAASVGRRNALYGVSNIVHALGVATTAISETSALMHLSSAEHEDSDQQTVITEIPRHSNGPASKQVRFKSDTDSEYDESMSAKIPLLNGACNNHQILYTENKVVPDQVINRIPIVDDFESTVFVIETCDEDAFV